MKYLELMMNWWFCTQLKVDNQGVIWEDLQHWAPHMSHLGDHLRTVTRFAETLHHCLRRFSLAFRVSPCILQELWVPGKPRKWIILSKACRRPKGWMMRCTKISGLLDSWGTGWKTRRASKWAKWSRPGSDFQWEPFGSRSSPSKID